MLSNSEHPLRRIQGRTIATMLGLTLGAFGLYFMYQSGFKFEGSEDFLSMGNRALFVWLSFGVSILAMTILYLQSHWLSKAVETYVKQQQDRAKRIIEAREKRKQKTRTGAVLPTNNPL
ncbi:heme exporter protein CcmD [Ningiella sp. W23]|uniref:heme exporter protein CcmD n=1 Tax=Ningiella sp. W23 TaxID=3023715 RepID=UPI0037562E48